MLLLCFAAGQYMVYAHQHLVGRGSNKLAYHTRDTQPKQTVTENCQLCDAMHHNFAAVNGLTFFTQVVVNDYFYKVVNHNFISVALILSAGRSPPMA